MADKYTVVISHLKTLYYHFSEDWVKECVDFYKNNRPNIQISVLKNEVVQQWLLLNLRDMKIPSLPPNLKNQPKIILPGKYVVQVETLLDSGQSCYSQWQSIRNESLENVKATTKPENEPGSRRCLTLSITDGVQELKAMEYDIIPQLKVNDPNLPPGFKILITGPVTCRRGMILLQKENVTICGGEVDTLAETHNYATILANLLGLEVPVISERDQSAMDVADDNEETVACSNVISSRNPSSVQLAVVNPIFHGTSESTSVSSEQSRRHFLRTDNSAVIEQCPPRIIEPTVSSVAYDDLFLENDDLLLSVPDCYSPPKVSAPTSKRAKIDSKSCNISKKKQTDISSFFKEREPENIPKLEVVVKTVSECPFVYLSQIVPLTLSIDSTFQIKAVILTLKTKIQVKNDAFTLICKISDGSLSIDASFATEVLEDMLGFSPCEMAQMYKSKSSNPVIAERLKSAFIGAQRALISLNCIFHITFHVNNALPDVVKLEEVKATHLTAMRVRRLL